MRILITGASGFLGSKLQAHLQQTGHVTIPLTRGEHLDPQRPSWNPEREEIDFAPAGTFDAVIHLAGENIAQRWTERTKERIYQSRVRGTGLLSRAIANLPRRPQVMLCASGIAYYGNRGDEVLDEASRPGAGFLGALTQDWESATEAAVAAGVRVVHLRIGMVLHPKGGALAKMLPLFRAGLGGRLGNGRQYWSWIALPDLLAAAEFTLNNAQLFGPFNFVAPNPVTNEQFTKILNSVLRRPTIFPAPAFALRLMVGEMADEALLASVRAVPERLRAKGFAFKYPDLKPALEALLLNHTAA